MLFYLGIALNLDNIFKILPNGDELALGKYVVILIGLGKLIDMSASVNGEIIMLSKYYKFNLITVMILAVCTIGFNKLFIPEYEMEGAAIATLFSLAVFNLSKFLFLLIKFKMQPFSLGTLKVIAIGIITFLLTYYLPDLESPIVDLILKSIFISLVFGVLIIILLIRA